MICLTSCLGAYLVWTVKVMSFKTSKTSQRNLFDEKGEKRKNFDGTCILTNITFILHFGLLPLQYLEFCYYMTADDKNGVTLYEKTAASKTNKYNATLEMVRSSRANALVTRLHFG